MLGGGIICLIFAFGALALQSVVGTIFWAALGSVLIAMAISRKQQQKQSQQQTVIVNNYTTPPSDPGLTLKQQSDLKRMEAELARMRAENMELEAQIRQDLGDPGKSADDLQ